MVAHPTCAALEATSSGHPRFVLGIVEEVEAVIPYLGTNAGAEWPNHRIAWLPLYLSRRVNLWLGESARWP